MGTVAYKTACENCRKNGNDKSGDNRVVYTDGSYHCFACGNTKPSIDFKGDNHVSEKTPVPEKKVAPITKEELEEIKQKTSSKGSLYRGITDETNRLFKVRYSYDEQTGKPNGMYVPTYINDTIVGCKVRTFPKTFWAVGNVGPKVKLMGEDVFKTHSKILLLVGGETKCLNAYQMLENNRKTSGKTNWEEVAVMSVLNGESGSCPQVSNRYEVVDRFEKIIVCMDNDPAGIEAAKKLCKVLPDGKVWVMQTRYKDIDDYVVDSDGKRVHKEHEFIQDFWKAKRWTPDYIKTPEQAFDEIEEELLRPRITLPSYMYKLQDMTRGGILQGRMFNVIAHTSVGKTTHVRNMVYHWIMTSPVTPTIISIEETAAQYVIQLIALHGKKSAKFISDYPKLFDWFRNSEEASRLKQELCFKEDGSPRFFIIDERSTDISQIEKQIETMFKKYGSSLFIMDVLSDLLRGSKAEKAEDHLNFQKGLMKYGATFGNVLHTRKPSGGKKQGKSEENDKDATEYDALGTGSFVQSAAYNFILNRDKLADSEIDKNTTRVDIPKCRGGLTGSAGGWYYDHSSSNCFDVEDWLNSSGMRGY